MTSPSRSGIRRPDRADALDGGAAADLRPPRPRRDGDGAAGDPRRRRPANLAPGAPRAVGQLPVLARAGHRPRVGAVEDLRQLPAHRDPACVRLLRGVRAAGRASGEGELVPRSDVHLWDLRPHPRLGTIEVRVCDAQTRVESVGAIAALVQALAATLAERLDEGRQPAVQPIVLVEENKWRAARDGLDALLVDLDRDEERPAREALLARVELARPAARRLGGEAELDEVA